MSEVNKVRWPVKIMFANGKCEKGYIMAQSNDVNETLQEIFTGNLHPFTLNTLGGNGLILVNTDNVAAIYFYNNNKFIG